MKNTSPSLPLGLRDDDPDAEITTVRTATIIRRSSTTEIGPRAFLHDPIDYQTPNQAFPSLYWTVHMIIKDCGACSRSDLGVIPALSRYSPFQLERALFTAEHHGLIRRIGSIPAHHPDADNSDDPDTENPGIYDVDPLGLIDRNNPHDIIQRALARRTTLEVTWLTLGQATCPASPSTSNHGPYTSALTVSDAPARSTECATI